MTATEPARFDELYNRHLRTLKLRGMSDKTIDSYARAVSAPLFFAKAKMGSIRF